MAELDLPHSAGDLWEAEQVEYEHDDRGWGSHQEIQKVYGYDHRKASDFDKKPSRV